MVRRMNAMERPVLREVVRQNCVALFMHRFHCRKMSWLAFSRFTGIGNGTAQRINEQSADASLSTLDAISRAFGLHAWQMLIPSLDPTNPPVFVMTSAERKLYDSLRSAVNKIAEQPLYYKTGKAS
jgi:hypothetical protein